MVWEGINRSNFKGSFWFVVEFFGFENGVMYVLVGVSVVWVVIKD